MMRNELNRVRLDFRSIPYSNLYELFKTLPLASPTK